MAGKHNAKTTEAQAAVGPAQWIPEGTATTPSGHGPAQYSEQR
jgi:hypothetical protein